MQINCKSHVSYEKLTKVMIFFGKNDIPLQPTMKFISRRWKKRHPYSLCCWPVWLYWLILLFHIITRDCLRRSSMCTILVRIVMICIQCMERLIVTTPIRVNVLSVKLLFGRKILISHVCPTCFWRIYIQLIFYLRIMALWQRHIILLEYILRIYTGV